MLPCLYRSPTAGFNFRPQPQAKEALAEIAMQPWGPGARYDSGTDIDIS